MSKVYRVILFAIPAKVICKLYWKLDKILAYEGQTEDFAGLIVFTGIPILIVILGITLLRGLNII